MTKKAEFNAEEWATIVEGPLLAGMRVVTAQDHGAAQLDVRVRFRHRGVHVRMPNAAAQSRESNGHQCPN